MTTDEITTDTMTVWPFPHTPYAEDQQLPRLILTTHVLYRGFQTGAFMGLLIGSARTAFRHSPTPSHSLLLIHARNVIRSTGIGGAVGIGLMSVELPLQMRGKELIEWQDRSWRLLENKGQVAVDRWSIGGATVGAVAVVCASRRRLLSLSARNWLGGLGAGSLVGVLGYMGSRISS